jgi:hypothetical protein
MFNNLLRAGVLTFCAFACLFGQAFTSLSGTVTDPTGAVIPKASIVLENVDTGISRVTVADDEGRYSFPQVLPGTYRLRGKAAGFADVIVNDVRLMVNTPTTVNVAFEKLGATVETVSIIAEAVQVNTTDATLGNAFNTNAITQLPFEARNVVGLLSLQPGVTLVNTDVTDDRNGAVSGGRPDQANVTLDGVDVNDQQYRYAFTSVLRVTLDSVQEFRVTTVNANADQGRTSGAQIALVTKTGTNSLHGSLYEFHRNTITSANSFFNNASRVARPKLIRNIFGGAIGGPIARNRLFYFFNYEGRRDAREGSAVRIVPSVLLRQGIVQYTNTSGGVSRLTPDDLRSRVDPAGQGVNQAVLNIFRTYPEPNDFTVGDNLNRQGFRFKAPIGVRQNTYIARFDYTLDQAAKHQLFARGNLQNDHENELPQFPGEQPNRVLLNNSKGVALGYTAMWTPSVISVTRYGFTRQGDEQTGIQSVSAVSFRSFDDRFGLTRGITRILPVHHVSQDVDWTRGAHNIRAGGVLRWIRNSRSNFANSFHGATTNASWLLGTGADLRTNVPDLAVSFRQAYYDATLAVLGIVTQGTARYNYDIQGNAQPVGSPVVRKFASEEYELYVQDTWRATRALTVTAGVRWSLMPPVYEANGLQISTNQSLGAWFNKRGELMLAGRSQSEAGKISYVLQDQGRPLYPTHKKNFAPRIALAYSPQSTDGFAGWLFGGPGRTSIRAGWGMYYDLFGQGLMRTFDASAFGLSTSLSNRSSQLTSTTAPRFTGLFSIPSALIQAAPPGGFPQQQPENFAITNSIDDQIKPPYSMSMNLTIGREFGGGIYVQGSYVGRQQRRSLVQRDLAMPTDLVDPASRTSYFEAAKHLALVARAGTPVAQIGPIAYWENLFPGLAGGGLTATQVMYTLLRDTAPDYSTAQTLVDVDCDPACSKLGPYAMFNPQFSALSAWSSIGSGNYHGMQWTVRKRFSSGTQFDVNYTWSKSLDMTSQAERATSFGGGTNGGFIINSWQPHQLKAVSEYDIAHQFNANWIVQVPVGRGQRWGTGMGRALDALVGGWQLSGLWRWTSGTVAWVNNGRFWPTNWNISGFATRTGPMPDAEVTKNAPAVTGTGGANMFADPATAIKGYSNTLPGESGTRNGLRGDGLFQIDAGLGKRFLMPYSENHSIQFRAEAFNVLNQVRFDPRSASLNLGSAGTFGKYSDTLTTPRVMQFALRYEF